MIATAGSPIFFLNSRRDNRIHGVFGAERMLNNKEIGCSIRGLDFNAHGKHHIIRAAQEGLSLIHI